MALSNIVLCYALYLMVAGYLVSGRSDPSIGTGKVDLIQVKAGDGSSERQLISSLRRWIFGSQQDRDDSQTKVKYMPIYVPVPVYSDGKAPLQAEFYGALQHKKVHEQQHSDAGSIVIQMPNPGYRPYSTVRGSADYGPMHQLFHRQSIPFYLTTFGENFGQHRDGYNGYGSFHGNGGYEYDFDNYDYGSGGESESNEVDSVVIDNPELITNPDDEGNADLYLKRRRKYRKKAQ